MTSKLSNAVSHMSLWSLGVFLHPCEIWRFFHNFERKSDIFTTSMEYQKTMNIEWNVTFSLGWLYEWLTRRWKAQNKDFSKTVEQMKYLLSGSHCCTGSSGTSHLKSSNERSLQSWKVAIAKCKFPEKILQIVKTALWPTPPPPHQMKTAPYSNYQHSETFLSS